MTRTLFIDIDGTLLKHHGQGTEGQVRLDPCVLPGVKEFLLKAERNGDSICLVTGRKESMRAKTVAQLQSVGISFDVLLMGVPRGPRIVINDMKPKSDKPMAIGISVVRNAGLKNAKF